MAKHHFLSCWCLYTSVLVMFKPLGLQLKTAITHFFTLCYTLSPQRHSRHCA